MRNEHDWCVELMSNVEDHECYVALTKDIRRIQEEAWKAAWVKAIHVCDDCEPDDSQAAISSALEAEAQKGLP